MKTSRLFVPTVALAAACFALSAAASTTEDGGSGLVRIDYAWSLSLTDFILAIDGNYLSHNFTPGTSRYLRLTPSVTKGLGAGFEASAALPFDALSQRIEESAFDRRIDIRRRDLQTKVRWTGPLGGPRARFGAQGMLTLPLDGLRDARSGGTKQPDNAFDPGVAGLLSTNVGWFDFPVRLHVNVGYWWSRDDGAVYYQDHPLPLLLDQDISNNDVVSAGLAVEAGFQRFVFFTELTTEQLIGARAQVRGQENLWRLTPGLRTEISPSIALTASGAFDLASDDPRTTFDPKDVYADFELRIALSLGNVLSRNKYEGRERGQPSTHAWKLGATDAMTTSVPTVHEPVVQSVPAGRPAAIEAATPAPAPSPAPTPTIVDTTPAPDLERRLEERLDRFELGIRMMLLEARLNQIERQGGVGGWSTPQAGGQDPVLDQLMAQVQGIRRDVAPQTVTPATPTPASPEVVVPTPASAGSDSTRREIAALRAAVAAARAEADSTRAAQVQVDVRDQLAAMNEEIRRLRAEQTASVATTPTTPTASLTPPSAPTADQLGSQLPALRVTQAPAPAATVPTTPVPMIVPQPIIATPAAPQASVLQPVYAEAEVGDLGQLISQLTEQLSVTDSSRVPVPDAAPAPAPAPPVFPLLVGQSNWIDDLSAGMSRDAFIADWAPRLLRNPGIRVSILVHGGGPDRAAALQLTDAEAKAWRDRFVRAGVPADQLVPLGMGIADTDLPAGTMRAEIERLQ